MIDFGGGSGFLSMLAKSIGIGHVIYVDLNPLSVQAAFRLKEYTGTGADLFLGRQYRTAC
jgi:Ribosomal protein L11 methylase